MEFDSPSERLWQRLHGREFLPALQQLASKLALAHPAHWLMLAALTALLASNALPRWTLTESYDGFGRAPRPERFGLYAIAIAGLVGHPVALLASIRAIYLAFSNASQSFRKFVYWTALPIVLGNLLPMAVWTIAVNVRESSVLAPPLSQLTLPGVIGPRPILAAAALAALGIIYWRAANAKIPMPISFAIPADTSDDNAGRSVLKFFVWTAGPGYIAAGILLAVTGALGAFFFIGPEPIDVEAAPFGLTVLGWVQFALATLPVTVVALILWGTQWRAQLRALLRGARGQDYAIAIAAPVGTYLLARLLIYGSARIMLGLSEDFSFNSPPPFSSVFALPAWSSVMFILPAFLEEIGWRGYFQTHLIRRFGITRGLVLVGLAWGAWHFPNDLAGSQTLAEAAMGVFGRLLFTTALGGLFGWLFLRSGSVLPVTLLHVLSNTLSSIPAIEYSTPVVNYALRLLPVMVLVWMLFRVYPPHEAESPKLTSLEEATAPEAPDSLGA